MTPINYRYFLRGNWLGPANEKPAVIGRKFLRTLDALSGIDPLCTGWQFTGPWQIPEENRLSFVPLAIARKRIASIVEGGVYIDDFNEASMCREARCTLLRHWRRWLAPGIIADSSAPAAPKGQVRVASDWGCL